MRQACDDAHVSPVKSKEFDQLMEPAPITSRGEDERRLDALGVLAGERILR